MDLVGFGIIIPIQPFFAETLGAKPTVVTLLGASFSLMQFLFSPVWGRLSDRFGRRGIMLTSIAFTALGYFIFGSAKTLGMLFFARMLAGFGSANLGTAQAIIADITSHENRAKGMGLIGAAFGLGFIFGPAIGGFVSHFYGLSAPAYAAAALSSLNLVSAFLFLPETHDKSKAVLSRFSWLPISIPSLESANRHPNVGRLFSIFLMWTVAFSMMEQVLGLFVEAVWVKGSALSGELSAQKSAAMTASILMVVGITATIVQGGLIGKLATRFGEKKLLISGTFIVASVLLLLPFVAMMGWYGVFLASFALMAVGTGITNPSLSSLLSQAAPMAEQGTILGMGQAFSALGRVIGPTMAGYLFELKIGVPFWAGAVLTFIACLSASRLPYVRRRSTGATRPH